MKNYVNLIIPDFQPLALSIFVDAFKIPQGIMVPLSDWLKLKPALNPESPLYKLMAALTFVPFHELPLKEKSVLLEDKLQEVEQANLKKGSYRVYKNELCTSPELYINEYIDHKELVSMDAKTGKIILVKKLH
ncbi:hypothetical protein [Pedobacter aquatilis]|uniref:hypothetical protein n=1 Tax=Pedobacter aquatilis TaxID=351343 RepID=UPI00292E2CF7|nr:hypothetical protein [Pedobacter aquatilis]